MVSWFGACASYDIIAIVPLLEQSEANKLLVWNIYLWKFHSQSRKRYARGEIFHQNSVCCMFRVDALKYLFPFFHQRFRLEKPPLVNKFNFMQAERRLINFYVRFQPIYTENSEISFHYQIYSSTEGFILDKCTSCLLASNWCINNRTQLVYVITCTCAEPWTLPLINAVILDRQ